MLGPSATPLRSPTPSQVKPGHVAKLLEIYFEEMLEFAITREQYDEQLYARWVAAESYPRPDLLSAPASVDNSRVRDKLWTLFEQNAAGVSALDVICGLSLVAGQSTAADKMSAIYDAYDFQKAGKISEDEVCILLLASAKGAQLLTGLTAKHIPEERLETCAKHCDEASAGDFEITKPEFVAWVKTYVKLGDMEDVDLRTVMARFGLCDEPGPTYEDELKLLAKVRVFRMAAPGGGANGACVVVINCAIPQEFLIRGPKGQFPNRIPPW